MRVSLALHSRMTPQEALSEVIKIVGNARALAKHFEIKPPAVYQWKKAPAERVLELERLSGGKVSRHDLRPDVFGSRPTKRTRKVPA